MKNVLLWICALALIVGCQNRTPEIEVLGDQPASGQDQEQYVVNGGPGSTEITYKDNKGNELSGTSNVVRVPILETCEGVEKTPEEIIPQEGPEENPEEIQEILPEENEEVLFEVEEVAYRNFVFASATKAPEISYETEVYIERMPPKIILEKSSDEDRLCCDSDLTFRIKFTNSGGDDARDIDIFDIIPDKTEYLEGTAGSDPYLADILVDRDEEQLAKKITWKIEGPIAPGESGEVYYKVSCPKKRPVLACYLKFEPKQLKEGEKGKLVYSVTNSGAGAAEEVKMFLNLPRGIQIDGQRGPARKLMTFGSIDAKDTVSETLDVEVLEGGRIDGVTGSVTAVNWEGCECEIPETPSLEVRKDGLERVINPADLTYTIAVENTSHNKAPATNCILIDELPPKASFKEADQGGVFDPEKHIVTWELGTLMPGQIVSRVVKVLPKKSGAYRDKAHVTCDEGITVDDEATTIVKGIAAVHILSYDTEDPVEVGNPTTYVIEVRNEGFEDVTNMVLKSSIPRLTEFIEASAQDDAGNSVGFEKVGDEIVYDSITLESGEKATYRITVLVKRQGELLNVSKLSYNEFSKVLVVEEPTTPYDSPDTDNEASDDNASDDDISDDDTSDDDISDDNISDDDTSDDDTE